MSLYCMDGFMYHLRRFFQNYYLMQSQCDSTNFLLILSHCLLIFLFFCFFEFYYCYSSLSRSIFYISQAISVYLSQVAIFSFTYRRKVPLLYTYSILLQFIQNQLNRIQFFLAELVSFNIFSTYWLPIPFLTIHQNVVLYKLLMWQSTCLHLKQSLMHSSLGYVTIRLSNVGISFSSISKCFFQLKTYAEVNAETTQLKILSMRREKRVVFLLKTKEYSSDWPYARNIYVKLSQTYFADQFIRRMALKSLGFQKLWREQNLVKPLPLIMI